MRELIVKSNFARNKTILLDGRYPLVFNDSGEAKMPAHLREALEVEMRMKPNRFWVVEPDVEAAPVVEQPAPVVVEEVKVEKVEIPPEVDLSYLNEEKKAPVKAAKKK